MTASVFISYRRNDSRYQARMIYGAFQQAVPRDRLFMDVDLFLQESISLECSKVGSLNVRSC